MLNDVFKSILFKITVIAHVLFHFLYFEQETGRCVFLYFDRDDVASEVAVIQKSRHNDLLMYV